MTFRLPHPVVSLVGGVAIAAALTWTLSAGEFDRREDPATGRQVVIAGTYHAVPRAPVGPFGAAVALPTGFVDAADVIAVVLFVGGAWVVVDRLGTLRRLVAALAGRVGGRAMIAIPIVTCFFAAMGALENMQEEIIPLVPVLLVLGRELGLDEVTVVAMSAGAAMVGSAFGPTNPFQAGIAMKLAEVPVWTGGRLRVAMFVAAVAIWVLWTLRYARTTGRRARPHRPDDRAARLPASARDLAILAIMLTPMAVYVYGAVAWGWGFNELSGGFLVGGVTAGLIGGLGIAGTTTAYLEGMQSLLTAALLVGVARSISVVLAEGHVIDSILWDLSKPLAHVPPTLAMIFMVPAHAILHVPVPSVSGQAVLTMPIFIPLSDLLAVPRLAAVLAYETGAGLTELLTPTNGALMAILLAAGVSYGRWMRFALLGTGLVAVVGFTGILMAR